MVINLLIVIVQVLSFYFYIYRLGYFLIFIIEYREVNMLRIKDIECLVFRLYQLYQIFFLLDYLFV